MSVIQNCGYRVGAHDGFYGEFRATKDEVVFVPWGRDVRVNKVLRSLETGEFALALEFNVPKIGKTECVLTRSEIAENGVAAKLSAKGASVSSKRADALQMYLNAQYENFQGSVSYYHDGAGWIEDSDGDVFRAYNSVGGKDSVYHGDLDIKPHGSFEAWKNMVVNDVLPYPALTTVLLAGLSSVLVGFLHRRIPLLNPIFSICGISSSGKSTAGVLAASTAFRPTLGVRKTLDRFGESKNYFGGITTWDASKSALLTRLNSNCGMVAVLDELSKSEIKDLSTIVYSLSEGVDKERLTKECTRRAQPDFHTTLISIGEERLLDRCKKFQEGLPMRVMEISGKLTESAEHSNRIVTACRENYGFAAPMLANYIIGLGAETLLEIYHKRVRQFRSKLPDSPFADRRAQQFGGLLLTTATIAKKALGIAFDVKELCKVLVDLENASLANSDTAAKAYSEFLDWVEINRQKFDNDNRYGERYGKLYIGNSIPRRRLAPENLLREIAVFPQIFQRFLEDRGYTNKAQLIKKWRKEGLVITDQQKTTYRRKIGGVPHDLIIVREFSDPDTQGDEEDSPSNNRSASATTHKSHVIFSQVEQDLAEEEMG